MNIIYLDSSSTTKPHPKVVETMCSVMTEDYGNPSSLHTMGVAAEKIVEAAREKVARPLKVSPQDVYFTSGGTESNNIALLGAYNALRIKGEVIVPKTEHKSVVEVMNNFENVRWLDVDSNGQIDLETLENMVSENTSIVSIMHVNNETGAVLPIEKIYKIVKDKNPNTLFHTDAVQSYCKIPFPKNSADLISISAHKIHGPKGVGAVYVKKGVRVLPIIFGGGQEKGIRCGTENTPAIAGFGVVAEQEFDLDHVQKINQIMRNSLKGVTINSPQSDHSPYVLNVAAEGIRSEILLHALEHKGVMVSSGSACSSNRPRPSHVLKAMGIEDGLIDSSIRISFSPYTTEEETKRAAEIINETIEILHKQIGRR